MKIRRMDHVGIVVDDLAAAKAFFIDLGMEVQGEAEMEGALLDRVIGLHGAKTAVVFLRTPDGQTALELAKFYAPPAEDGPQPAAANTPGIRHLCFEVDDLDAIVATLQQHGTELFSEIQYYEHSYKLCYVRGPEGIILELAESIK